MKDSWWDPGDAVAEDDGDLTSSRAMTSHGDVTLDFLSPSSSSSLLELQLTSEAVSSQNKTLPVLLFLDRRTESFMLPL
jgi:hypothetical protein